MTGLGVRRLVATTPYPLVGDRPRVAMWVLRCVLADAYADARASKDVMAASDLDWTVVTYARPRAGPSSRRFSRTTRAG
jgi:hypothetical protein